MVMEFSPLSDQKLFSVNGGMNGWYFAGGCAAVVAGIASGVAAGWTGVGIATAVAGVASGIAMICGAF